MKQISINTDYITLSQFLKLADWISSGGQAKFFLSEHQLFVNGEAESRRGRKLVPGDVIEAQGFGAFRIIGS